jgi:hypothetical protein
MEQRADDEPFLRWQSNQRAGIADVQQEPRHDILSDKGRYGRSNTVRIVGQTVSGYPHDEMDAHSRTMIGV